MSKIKLFIDKPILSIMENDEIKDDTSLSKSIVNALHVFNWMHEEYEMVDLLEKSTYAILDSHRIFEDSLKPEIYWEFNKRKYYFIFSDECDLFDALNTISIHHPYKWAWKYSTEHPGYEVTSRGDKRFSPYFQKILHEGILISAEEYFHKCIEPKKLAGEDVTNTGHAYAEKYLLDNQGLYFELARIGQRLPFTDMFDKYGGQNRWYADILNEHLKDRINEVNS